jgi:hypothetical protein
MNSANNATVRVETMTYISHTQFELALEAGHFDGREVEVRWTNSFRFYRAIAKVVRVNKSSVRVTVTRPVKDGEPGAYLVGRTLSFPRFMGNKWSVNNGAFPMADECAEHADCLQDRGLACACLASRRVVAVAS